MKIRWLILLVIILGMVSISWAEEIVLEQPIAYIGNDGNVYVTALETIYALTDDAIRGDDGRLMVFYSSPLWSSNGQHLAFFRNHGTGTISTGTGIRTQALVVASSGEPPRMVLSVDDGYTFDSTMLALSPDGSQLAFFGWNQEQREQNGVFVLSLDNSEVTFVGRAISASIGEPNAVDPAIHITKRVIGASSYRDQFALAWGESGILYTPADDIGGLALVTPEGEYLWNSEGAWNFILSPDGAQVIARSVLSDEGWITLDINTGERIPLHLPENATPVGWIGDQLYYRTQTDIIRVTGDREMAAGIEMYDWIWGFEATSSTLTIFAYVPDGEDVRIAQIQGYDIGRVEGPDITHMLVSFVRSSVPAVLLINEGAAVADVEHLKAHTESILLRLAYKEFGVRLASRTTIPGNGAVYSSGEFVVVTDS